MSQQIRYLTIAVVGMTLIGNARNANAGDVPFLLAGAGSGSLVTGDFTAAGVATHLGSWTNTGNLVVTGAPPVLDVNGTVSFVAADGSRLDALIQNGLLDVSQNPNLGIADTVFIGGTGRFANATGSGTMIVHSTPPDANGNYDFDFTLEGDVGY